MIVPICRKAWERAGRGRMLLAVSGGPDSTALLRAFLEAGVPAEAAHCNFNLRGDESLRDREFVITLCNALGVRLHMADFDVEAMALKGESTEMTCRRLRYDFFRRLKLQGCFGRIVLGHNADDNIETFFLNALRGSGSRGLRAMEPDTGELLRPLLQFRRSDIIRYLEAIGQNYVTDSSNLKSDHYRRNFLRNEIFPLLESRWPGAARAISATIEIQQRENGIIEHFVRRALEGADLLLGWDRIRDFPDPETLIYSFIRNYGGTPSIAREMALSSIEMVPGKRWCLSENAEAIFKRSGIQILLRDTDTSPDKFVWEKIEGASLDFDKIKSCPLSELFLPSGEEFYEWVNADRAMKIKALGMRGSSDVWRVLKDAGLSAPERERFRVLIEKESGEPVWLPGIKRARVGLVNPDADSAWHVYREDSTR